MNTNGSVKRWGCSEEFPEHSKTTQVSGDVNPQDSTLNQWQAVTESHLYDCKECDNEQINKTPNYFINHYQS